MSMPAAAPPPLTGFALIAASFAVAMASFMNVLDTTIVIVALPTIAGNLAATPSQASWIVTSYGVCMAIVLPLTGWVSRRYGQVRVFCFSLAMFTLCSWLCAAAMTFNQLLLFRALQGLSGGLLIPLSQSVLLRMYPPERHGFALAIWGITSVVAPVIGPIVGGYLTDTLGWPWIFYLNVPIGIVASYVSWVMLKDRESERVREPVDAFGLILLVLAVLCFQLVLDRGHELDWLASTEVCVLLGTSVTAFLLFVAWERNEPYPIVDHSLFRHANFMIGSLGVALFFGVYMVSNIVFPLWVQTMMGYTAPMAGMLMAPTGLVPLLFMPFFARYLHLFDLRMLVTVGAVILVTAYYRHATATTDVSADYIAWTRFILGTGMPLYWMPMMTLSLTGLPPEKLGSAAGLFNFMRMAASSMGTAAAVTLWDQRSIYHRERIVESLAPGSPEFDGALHALDAATQGSGGAWAVMEQLIVQQARTLGMQDVFALCIGGLLLIPVMVWFVPARIGHKPATVVAGD